MMRQPNPDYERLHAAYGDLVKAGRHSLAKAYQFGEVICELSNTHTLADLADELGVSPAMTGRYRRLRLAYDTLGDLLARADRLGTYDVAKLTEDMGDINWRWGHQCQNCLSTDVKKVKIGLRGEPLTAGAA